MRGFDTVPVVAIKEELVISKRRQIMLISVTQVSYEQRYPRSSNVGKCAEGHKIPHVLLLCLSGVILWTYIPAAFKSIDT